MTSIETIRAAFAAYLAQDRTAEDRLLADNFVFTSPQDDHIDKAAFMERCFPTASRLQSQNILQLVPATGDGAFIMYEYMLTTGERHRNVEFIRVKDDRLVESQVYFGGRF